MKPDEFESCEPELAGALASLVNTYRATGTLGPVQMNAAERLLSNYRRNGGKVEFAAMAREMCRGCGLAARESAHPIARVKYGRTMWETSDGQLWNDRGAADYHERHYKGESVA